MANWLQLHSFMKSVALLLSGHYMPKRCSFLQAVRAMRFDPAAHKPKDKLPTERTMTDAEVAKAIEEAESEEP